MSSPSSGDRQQSAGLGTDRSPIALSARQERALGALLSAHSVEEAAKRTGVGVRTLYRWLAESDAFGAAYRESVEGMRIALITSAHGASMEALAALRSIAANTELRPSDRVAAASRILEATAALASLNHGTPGEAGVRTVLCYPVPVPAGGEAISRAHLEAAHVAGHHALDCASWEDEPRINLDHSQAGGRHVNGSAHG